MDTKELTESYRNLEELTGNGRHDLKYVFNPLKKIDTENTAENSDKQLELTEAGEEKYGDIRTNPAMDRDMRFDLWIRYEDDQLYGRLSNSVIDDGSLPEYLEADPEIEISEESESLLEFRLDSDGDEDLERLLGESRRITRNTVQKYIAENEYIHLV